jgi:hypothetical protein
MRFYGDMTQAEIGQQLGISQMHVSRLLARALGYLRPRLLSLQECPAGISLPAAQPGARPGVRGRPRMTARPARATPARKGP